MDRELLELAAKAAGIEFAEQNDDVQIQQYVERAFVLKNGATWNPLTDDGDALRLAVKLNMRTWIRDQDFMHHNHHVEVQGDIGSGVTTGHVLIEPIQSDPYAATRRAIVRAAAEIGRDMP